MNRYDIVVYGATMPGIAAVRTATAVDRSLSILVVNPRRAWGGISSGGGQNFWDRRLWDDGGHHRLVQGGSFRNWYDTVGQAYNTDRMARLLRAEADSAEIRDDWDITDATVRDGAIEAIELTAIDRSSGGPPRLTDRRGTVTAEVFLDASESGRLTRLAEVPHTVGRADWADDDRQMATTLMFRAGDLDWDRIAEARRDGASVFETRRDPDTDKRLFWGGGPVVENDPDVASFHQAHPRFEIKPMNAAEHDDGEFWINTLLFYDVDGTRSGYDGPSEPRPDGREPWDRWTARRRARETIKTPEFERAMRSFPGFEDASLPTEDADEDRFADLLYLRETVHAGSGSFALTRTDIEAAGTGPAAGADVDHYDSRIGLGYYWLDNNGYVRDEGGPELGDAANPVYIPYETLLAPTVENLLLPGYATSVSGEAWFSIRVLPNLCVLGDAAGVAAALAVKRDVSPEKSQPFVSDVQERLRDNDAILDKTDTPKIREVPADD